jgi:hypothetical protein
VDIGGWLFDHGVTEGTAQHTVEGAVLSCQQVKVGLPLEDALLCVRLERRKEGRGAAEIFRLLFRRVLYVVRAKRPVSLVDEIELITSLDRESISQPNLLDFALTVDPDGQGMSLQDDTREAIPAPDPQSPPRPIRGCADAVRELDKIIATDLMDLWSRFDKKLVRAACERRGRWRWRGNRMVREASGGVAPP